MSSTIEEIGKVCKKSLAEVLELMKSLQDEESEYIDDVLDSFGGGDEAQPERSRVLDVLQNLSVSLIGDAEVIDNEIEHFKATDAYNENCPYLSQVWNGDIYDEVEEDGLKALLKDLKEQNSRINEEYIIRKALEELQ